MKTVAVVIGVSRSNLIERLRERPKKRIGQPPLPDGKLVAEIKAVIAELPTYGYRRVHAILKRRALATGLKPPNHKRVYRVMKVHGLLLDRHAGGVERRHDGRIAVDERNRRWCSDGFEIGCDNAVHCPGGSKSLRRCVRPLRTPREQTHALTTLVK